MATTDMKPHTFTARMVGVLFLVSTIAYMIGTYLIESLLTRTDYLLHIYPHRTQLITGVVLQLVNAAAVVGIAVLLFPIVKQQSERSASGISLPGFWRAGSLSVPDLPPSLSLVSVRRRSRQERSTCPLAARWARC